ncbi:MAG TPA: serine/threonine-protein kinase [Kofleriaceae bacterium]|jgi:tetratricopeptide (TPR) repeat protein
MDDETLPLAEVDRVEALPRFAPGTSIGRFRIVGELGAGGMGIVFEAYDPELGRAVALKVVHEAGGRTLLDEAQAMARLAHPNVVPVHEVGTIDGRLFLVMELVRGETLARWLEEPRTWREIVRAFLAAGAGLVAAHEAGLVHRDFKPSNVLVDRSGHVRVADFGLARANAVAAPRPAQAAGTPGYMAPEQREGGAVDERSDEYAFGISLERALDGKRAPRRIHAALARATAAEPDARFPALAALLAVLARALETRRRYAVIAAAAVAAAAAAVAAVAWTTRPTDDCASGAALIDSVWSSPGADALAHQLDAARPTATVEVATMRRVLDGWAESWRLGRREACLAEPSVRPARLACLDGALGELRAQLAAWTHADAAAIDRIASSAGALADPAQCARPAPPTSAAACPLLARADALAAAHRAGTARAVAHDADALVADARALGEPGASAAVLLAAGAIASDLGDVAKARDEIAEAVVAAGKAGDDARLLDALRDEAIVTTALGRPVDGLGLLDAADAVAARSGMPDDARDAVIRGNALLDAGKLADAERVLAHAVALLEPLAQKDPLRELELADALSLLGDAYYQGSELAKARPLYLRSLAIAERMHGPMHPTVGNVLADLSELEGKADMLDEADAHLERARAVYVAAFGPDDARVAQTLVQRGYLAARRGKLDVAEQLTEQARGVLAHSLPADDLAFVSIETQLGAITGCTRGIAHFERALAILEQRHEIAETHAVILGQLAVCEQEVGRFDDAFATATKSVAELEQAGAAPEQCALSWMTLADLEARRGDKPHAIALAEHMLAATGADGTEGLASMRAHETAQLAVWKR